jgi:hypothetical protein
MHAPPFLASRLSVALTLQALASLGCSSGSSGSSSSPESGAGGGAEDFAATAATFDCLQTPSALAVQSEWTQVGASMFKNVLGHTDEMLAVARSADGGTFPVGTVIQLVPTEASVKRRSGFNAASSDWEFFALSVASTGTTINTRGGGANVLNAFGMSCLNCHGKAQAQWDLLCGDVDGGNTHGCNALPLSGPQLATLRSSDPRCSASDAGAE